MPYNKSTSGNRMSHAALHDATRTKRTDKAHGGVRGGTGRKHRKSHRSGR